MKEALRVPTNEEKDQILNDPEFKERVDAEYRRITTPDPGEETEPSDEEFLLQFFAETRKGVEPTGSKPMPMTNTRHLVTPPETE